MRPAYDDIANPGALTLRVAPDGGQGATHIITLPADDAVFRCCLGKLGANGWAKYRQTGQYDPPDFDYVEGLPGHLLDAIVQARGLNANPPTLIILDVAADEVGRRAETVVACDPAVRVKRVTPISHE